LLRKSGGRKEKEGKESEGKEEKEKQLAHPKFRSKPELRSAIQDSILTTLLVECKKKKKTYKQQSFHTLSVLLETFQEIDEDGFDFLENVWPLLTPCLEEAEEKEEKKETGEKDPGILVSAPPSSLLLLFSPLISLFSSSPSPSSPFLPPHLPLLLFSLLISLFSSSLASSPSSPPLLPLPPSPPGPPPPPVPPPPLLTPPQTKEKLKISVKSSALSLLGVAWPHNITTQEKFMSEVFSSLTKTASNVGNPWALRVAALNALNKVRGEGMRRERESKRTGQKIQEKYKKNSTK
jgi:hypothetical protein